MIKKTIKYIDYDGNEREEDFFFDLNKAECAEKDMRSPGGYRAYCERIISSHDGNEIMTLIKDFIFSSYGEKSPDGKYLMKSPDISRRFECTNAYSEFFMSLVTNAKAAAEFISGVLPLTKEQEEQYNKEMNEKIEELEKANTENTESAE